MSARKPRGTGGGTPSKKGGTPRGKVSGTAHGTVGKAATGGRGGAKSTASKRPAAASKVKPAPAPPPVMASPTGAPLAFGSRMSEMPPPAQARSVEAAAMRGMVAREGFRAVMSLKPEPPAGGPGIGQSVGDVEGKERQRLAAMRKETAKRPVATVRPDYFGTAEHRASAEQLARMLAGEQVFSKAPAKTHVLLRVASPNPVADAVLEREGLTVASADPSWRVPFQARLEELMARYRPLTELEIRPGLTLTYGEVVALAGDYYASPEELTAELTPAVADAIRGVTPTDEGTFLLNTHRGWFDYASLANENQDHFAPRSWARYAQHHAEALKLAAIHRNLDEALVRNAFADHFLTDAFASGHLRVPRNALVGLTGALPTRKMHDEENEYGLWVQSANGFVWRSYGDDYLGTNPVHLTLTAFAVGLSLLRIYKAYRLEGAAQLELVEALGEARPLELTAGEMVDPRTLPDFLGDIAGLPSIRDYLPVPLGIVDEPDTSSVLANYPPQVGLDGKKRKETPDFEAYFRIE